jgi:integrase/recombinase XerD
VNGLHRQLQNYLAIRRAMGFKMERHAKLLGQFADHLAAHDAATLTIEHALAWAGAPSAADPCWWAARLSMVRGFAVYLHSLDPAHVVPSLYTDPEIAALLHAAGELSGPLRAATYQTLIRLLAVTGMRVGEAIGLDREDFDEGLGLLTMHGTKFGKSRQLPLHPSASTGLRNYLDLRDRLSPSHGHRRCCSRSAGSGCATSESGRSSTGWSAKPS